MENETERRGVPRRSTFSLVSFLAAKPSEADLTRKGGARKRAKFSAERETQQSGLCDDLLVDAQLGDQSAVTLDVLLLQVVQQTAALADHLEQATTRVVVLGIQLQVSGEVSDALGQDSDLDLGRTGVALVGAVCFDDSSLLFFTQHG